MPQQNLSTVFTVCYDASKNSALWQACSRQRTFHPGGLWGLHGAGAGAVRGQLRKGGGGGGPRGGGLGGGGLGGGGGGGGGLGGGGGGGLGGGGLGGGGGGELGGGGPGGGGGLGGGGPGGGGLRGGGLRGGGCGGGKDGTTTGGGGGDLYMHFVLGHGLASLHLTSLILAREDAKNSDMWCHCL
jgi:hypothetical protein